MRSDKQTINLIRTLLTEHEDYWDECRPEMKKYRNVYENKFWQDNYNNDSMIRIETADCFSYVEGFIASLFSRQPAIAVGKDPSYTGGNPQLAQEVVNRFLFDQREQLELASRLALIYPNSFLKLSPQHSNDMLEQVQVRAMAPWEVLIDADASAWETQRFIGHMYYLTLPEAKEKFGAKDFKVIPKKDYFNPDGRQTLDLADLPDDYLYIQVIELYDMIYDKLIFWSPNWSNGEKLLQKSEIPLRTYDDKPLTPIVPLYYSRKPEKPMMGLSSVARVYDQFYEKNIVRTYWANSVRRDSRQYLYKEGALDEEALAQITSGVDGAMIPCDEPSLAGVIQAVGVEPISTNWDRYITAIDQDINRGSILAPFSRGEATKATATEITALAQYSASEIGKMARERDNAIEMLSHCYLRVISLLTEDGEKAVIDIEGLPQVIQIQDLDAKFKITALDQSSTPLSEAIKKNNLMQLFPVLAQLGVPPETMKEEIIRLYDLPKSFLEAIEQPQAPPGMEGMSGQAQAPQMPSEGDIGPSGELPAEQLANKLNKNRGLA
jgi:hypothetical protein